MSGQRWWRDVESEVQLEKVSVVLSRYGLLVQVDLLEEGIYRLLGSEVICLLAGCRTEKICVGDVGVVLYTPV